MTIPYCRKPCDECPWVRGNVGQFTPERFVALAPTAYDMAGTFFACHKSSEGRDAVCAGFALRAHHNLALRLAFMAGTIDPEQIRNDGRDLVRDYREMAIANGVRRSHPALRGCR